MVKIGDIELNSKFILPAIAGFSDIGLRVLSYRYGAGLCVGEMVSAKGLVYGSENTEALLKVDPREPIKAVQLFGSEPEFIEKAVKHKSLNKFDLIDLNFGCPVPKIVKNGEGSALMRDPYRLGMVVSTAVKAAGGRPVTAKMRIGFNENEINCVRVAKEIEEAGAQAITVHGRTREQFYSGEVNLDAIKAVKEAVSIPVFGNGNVTDLAKANEMFCHTSVDGIAVARGAIGRPYIFAELLGQVPLYDITELIMEHFALLESIMPERVAVNCIKKHIAGYTYGLRGGKDIKNRVFASTTRDEIIDVAKSFKNLVK
ncbi:MAG: tRNA dihydrouridine synthase DusB [Clostridia bacterium]|nr:tRNA dihydrouridine synthase DusB [Clostridia bacterium]